MMDSVFLQKQALRKQIDAVLAALDRSAPNLADSVTLDLQTADENWQKLVKMNNQVEFTSLWKRSVSHALLSNLRQSYLTRLD